LESHTLVGRSQQCGLRFVDPLVSSEHAAISWQDNGWQIKDLGSRNGTFVDGVRLEPGQQRLCVERMQLSFGRTTQPWRFLDVAAPRPMVTSPTGGFAESSAHGIIAIPNNKAPRATIYVGAHGRWVLETTEGTQDVIDGSTFDLAPDVWRFHCPIVWVATAVDSGNASVPSSMQSQVLHFKVSSDEEHVELDVILPDSVVRLGFRSAFYMLLTLARLRLAEAGTADCGWIHIDDLARMLRSDRNEINVWVYRIRERFADAGINASATIIERRTGTCQLRIGTENVRVSTA
jgi:hypothetical protein